MQVVVVVEDVAEEVREQRAIRVCRLDVGADPVVEEGYAGLSFVGGLCHAGDLSVCRADGSVVGRAGARLGVGADVDHGEKVGSMGADRGQGVYFWVVNQC